MTNIITDQQKIDALKKILDMYGPDYAMNVESLFRTETKHFKSLGFLASLSPGMEATDDVFPYGWGSLDKFVKEYPQYKPTGLNVMKDNDSALSKSRGERKFVVFESLEASMMFVAYRIKLKGGNFGAWFSNDKTAQENYFKTIKLALPRIVKSLIK